MTVAFLKLVNEYVTDSLFEASEEEIKQFIGRPGFPAQEDLDLVHAHTLEAIRLARSKQLEQTRAEFSVSLKERDDKSSRVAKSKRTVSNMLADIVAAINDRDKVPEGLVIAFREQGKTGSDSDIEKIWQDLVDLGLISPEEPGN